MRSVSLGVLRARDLALSRVALRIAGPRMLRARAMIKAIPRRLNRRAPSTYQE